MIDNRNESEFDSIRLFFKYVVRKLNLQHLLYFFVFVTFDIGDAVTASMMMEARGISAEYNTLVQQIFVNYGLSGLIAAKLALIIVPLIIASTSLKNSYWFINGVLVSLILAGLMATQANLQAMASLPYMSPMEINLLYLKILFVLSVVGMIMDSYFSESEGKGYSLK
ncbi:MAG: hypothetical protein C3F06_12645 [Candidatus Methanoperedenaceae archaeon]|nr:MAG: hypothetical protein C3F06_12645 [Candidatus Methanoperedenaceae archaeon]